MARKAEVIITCDASTVKQVLEGINREIAHTNQERKKLLDTQKRNGALTEDEKKQLRDLDKYLASLIDRQQKTVGEMRKFNDVIKDLAGSKLKDLKKALQEGKNALNNMSAKDPKRLELIRDLKKIQEQMQRNTAGVQSFGKAHSSVFATALKNITAYVGVFGMFNMIKSKLSDLLKLNKEFSDQMANVRKVSGLAMDDIAKLSDRLSGVDSRTSLKGLMDLSYTGAKLGYGDYGIEGLEQFAKSAVKVQNALKEDMGDEALTSLSKMVEVMGLIPKMGVERAMDATGSAIFKLAATSTATGQNIVEFSRRLMGLANIAHISTADLLAFGSAADSMAMAPEVASTAFNKLITAMQKQPNLIENALNIPKGTISNLYQTGKMTEAIVEVFEKMREKGGMNALMQAGVFKDLGSDGARLVSVMATMANRVDILQKHLETSRDAFRDGTAVAQEYAIQMDTAAAYSERAANMWEKAFVNPQGVDVVKELSKAWYDVTRSLTQSEKTMAGVKLALQGIVLFLKAIISIVPELLLMLGSSALVGWGTKMAVSMSEAGGAVSLLTTRIKLLTVAQKAFWGSFGFVGVALAIYEIGKAFYDAGQEAKEASVFMKGFKSDLSDVKKEMYSATRQLDEYVKAIKDAKEGTKERTAAINNFNSKFKGYLSRLLTEKSTASDLARAYAEVVKQMRAKIALQAKEKEREKFITPRVKWEADKLERFDQSRGGSAQNGTWLKGVVDDAMAKGTPLKDLVKQLNDRVWHLSDDLVENAFKQRSSANFKDVRGVDLGNKDDIFRKVNGRELWMAASYAAQAYSTNNAQRRLDKKYKPFEDDLKKETEDEKYDPLQDARDKDAERAAKKAKQEEKDRMRKMLKDAETETNAIIAKVEEWYTLQQGVVTDAYNDGQLTEQQMKNINQQLEATKNQALAAARRSLSGQDTKTWDTFKAQMHTLMLDQSDWSKELLDAIISTDMDALRNALARFDGRKSLEQWGFTSTAFRDGLNKNAAKNDAKVREIAARFTKQIEKALEQFQFVEIAQKKLQDDLSTMGFITETVEQMAARLQRGETKGDTVLRLNQTQQTARSQMQTRFGQTQMPTAERPEDMGKWFTEFTDNGKEEWMRALPELQKWVKDTDRYKDEIAQLYDLLQRGNTRQFQQQALNINADTESVVSIQPTQQQDTAAIDRLVASRITDEQAYRQMGNKFIEQGVISFRYNIDNEQEAQQWVRQFATDARGELEGWAQAFPELTAWIDLIKRKEQGETLGEAEQKALEEAMPRIRNLYGELLNNADRVNNAMKQAFQHEKQQQETRFRVAGYTDQETRIDSQLEMQGKFQSTMGSGQNFWQQNGLQDAMAEDPEIQRIQNRIYYRNLEYEDAKAHLEQMFALQEQEMQARREAGATQEELNQLAIQQQQARAGIEQLTQERATNLLNATSDLAAKVSQEIAERVSTIQSLAQPIADFAEDAGQKLGDMIFNMESQSMTWNQIWKKMVLALAQSTIKMGAQWLTQKIQQALFYKQMEADETMHQSIMTMIALGGAQARLAGETAINATRVTTNAATNAVEVGQEVSMATILTSLGISKGAAKIIGTLGWWGIPLIAVISSLLMGLLASALSTAGASSDATAGASSSASTPKTNLVSAMLTYDQGNVQQVGRSLTGRRKLYDDGNVQVYDRDGRRPVVGTDGRVYMVRDEQELQTGIVTTPTATSVNGQPAIVGERGPEIVIGRETTQQIMMNEPGLLQHLIDLDRYRSGRPYRAYDSGNVQDFGGAASSVESAFSADNSGNDDRIAAALERAAAAEERSNALMQSVLHYLQNPVAPNINMYGENGLGKKVSQYNKFMARYGG